MIGQDCAVTYTKHRCVEKHPNRTIRLQKDLYIDTKNEELEDNHKKPLWYVLRHTINELLKNYFKDPVQGYPL